MRGDRICRSHRKWGHAKAVNLHRRWLDGELGALSLERLGFCPAEIDALVRLRARVLDRLRELASADMACWCPLTSPWCHVETLLDRAYQRARLDACAA
jgi:hypothetical protein